MFRVKMIQFGIAGIIHSQYVSISETGGGGGGGGGVWIISLIQQECTK